VCLLLLFISLSPEIKTSEKALEADVAEIKSREQEEERVESGRQEKASINQLQLKYSKELSASDEIMLDGMLGLLLLFMR